MMFMMPMPPTNKLMATIPAAMAVIPVASLPNCSMY